MSGSTGRLLPARPKRGKGVRRLNRWPVYIGAAAVVVILLVVAYTYQQRIAGQKQAAAAAESQQTEGAASHAKDVVAVVAERAPRGRGVQEAARVDTPQAVVQQPVDMTEEARRAAWVVYFQRVAADRQAKDEAAGKALAGDTGIDMAGVQPGAMPAMAAATPGPNGLPVAGVDSGAQAEKRAFLAQGGDPLGLNEDLRAVLHDPKLDAIMQGTAIPGVMIGGLTSDMPGMIVGEVSDNVYDTATGNHLLIPQGSRVVGSYDNSVSNGQERIGVIWNRIIFPDTSSIQLGSMEGADQGGYAGFHDQVDTHFWSKFGSAILISIAGAGAQLSQPQAVNGQGYNPTQIGAASLGQQFGELGQEYARAGLAIPNTLDVRPGYVFVIMVAKDIHLPPYVDRRNAVASTSAPQILQ